MSEKTWQPAEGCDPSADSYPMLTKAGPERVIMLKTPAGFRAVEPRCPHLQAALTTAVQMSHGTMLRCTKHNFIFRLSDGKGVNCVGLTLKVYEVRERDSQLEVAI